jgi:hypothetical protein
MTHPRNCQLFWWSNICDPVVGRVFGGVQTAVTFLDNKSPEIVAKKLNIYFNKYDSTAYAKRREFVSPCIEEWNYTTWEVYQYCEGVKKNIACVFHRFLFPAFIHCIECSLKSH